MTVPLPSRHEPDDDRQLVAQPAAPAERNDLTFGGQHRRRLNRLDRRLEQRQAPRPAHLMRAQLLVAAVSASSVPHRSSLVWSPRCRARNGAADAKASRRIDVRAALS